MAATGSLVPASVVADETGWDVSTVRKRARAGRLPGSYNLDGSWRFDLAIIRRWIAASIVREGDRLWVSTSGAGYGESGSNSVAMRSEDPLTQALDEWRKTSRESSAKT